MNDRNAASVLADLRHLSTPRPNGSQALSHAVDAVETWLVGEGVRVESHCFTLRPYAMELLGLWFILGGLSLAAFTVAELPWLVLLAALALIAVAVLETRFLKPTVTALVRRRARNLVVSFPAPTPQRKAILSAHLDSKTELLDHERRARLLAVAPVALVMAPAGGILLIAASLLPSGPASTLVWYAGLLLGIWPAIGWALVMGANLAGGRLRRHHSTGAVDDGAAVAVLLDIACRLQRGTIRLDHTSVTLLFTVGEEAQMQGALAYVGDHGDRLLPTQVINLEIIGQNGGYLLWAQDGTSMQAVDVDTDINAALACTVEAETGERPTFHMRINSDAFAFLRRGIPAATLGSLDKAMGDSALHGPLDRPERIDPQRLAQTVDILVRLLADRDGTAH